MRDIDPDSVCVQFRLMRGDWRCTHLSQEPWAPMCPFSSLRKKAPPLRFPFFMTQALRHVSQNCCWVMERGLNRIFRMTKQAVIFESRISWCPAPYRAVGHPISSKFKINVENSAFASLRKVYSHGFRAGGGLSIGLSEDYLTGDTACETHRLWMYV